MVPEIIRTGGSVSKQRRSPYVHLQDLFDIDSGPALFEVHPTPERPIILQSSVRNDKNNEPSNKISFQLLVTRLKCLSEGREVRSRLEVCEVEIEGRRRAAPI